MLQLFTTDAFAEWFGALDDQAAEDVATSLEVIEQLGPARAAPGSRESLLWYEHPSVSRFFPTDALAWALEDWGAFRDYAKQVLAKLEAPRFIARVTELAPRDLHTVLRCTRAIARAADPRHRWTHLASGAAPEPASQPEAARDEVRRLYFEALQAAGFSVEDVPAHSRALRELSRRAPGPAFRLLYGVHAERETALVVLGERLDRSFYGDSVRRAERMWNQFLGGELRAVEQASLRR